MKNEHVGLTVVIVGAVIVYFLYKWSGAASNCSFFDSILGKCGTS